MRLPASSQHHQPKPDFIDEIGRGTSTYDGISIAWSIVEYLHHSNAQPKTLFATHYHELNELEEKLPGVKNYHVTNKEVVTRSSSCANWLLAAVCTALVSTWPHGRHATITDQQGQRDLIATEESRNNAENNNTG